MLEILFLILIKSILTIDKNLFAVVISSSNTYENYRHSVNPLLLYNFLKKNGIPDENIVLGLSEFHACSSRNYYPGKIYLSAEDKLISSCNNDISIDYKEADFHNFQFLDVLRGRSNNLINNFRKLNTDKHSRIIITIAAHGGENFIKFRGKSVVLSDEMNRTLWEMYHKQRYKEILFIVDTCEGESFWDSVDVPNIYFITSSIRDQKASSYSYDYKFMTPTVDRMHYKLNEYLERIYKEKNFNIPINNIFEDFKTKERNFISSDIAIINRIDREIIFHEFFGNYLNIDHLVTKYNFKITNKVILSDHSINNLLRDKRNLIEKEISYYNKLNQKSFLYEIYDTDNYSNKILCSISILGIIYILSLILTN